MSHTMNLSMIQEMHQIEKLRYSTEELANLMTEKRIEMEKAP
jgi:hypothetical protein